MNKQGRPSTFSQEIGEEICFRLAEGHSLRQICKADDMPSFRTVIRWALDPFSDFWHQYERARQLQGEIFADEVISIVDEIKSPEDAAFAKIRIDARKWAAGRMASKGRL
jgi:hypothetical protein